MAAQISNNSVKPNNVDQLVRAAQAGDRLAYEAIYHEFFPKISRFVGFRVNNRETAEDLIADIFVKAWEKLQGQDVIVSFSSWIFTIARNSVIDHYRTKKSFADLAELENLIEYEDNVINAIDLDIASKEFLKALETLNPDQQQVIRLKFLDDLENEEISTILEKPVGTIRVIQHRAILSLKNQINNKNGKKDS